MWKKETTITEISKKTKVSRPTIRKIIDFHLENRKWWITRTRAKEDVFHFIVNTYRQRAGKDGTAIERLQAGVLHYEVEGLLSEFIKTQTVYEIMQLFGRDPSGICVLHVKRSELKKGLSEL